MTTTITIDQEHLGDGVILYQVRMRDEIIWSGLGGSPVHALLRKLADMSSRSPDSRPAHDGAAAASDSDLEPIQDR